MSSLIYPQDVSHEYLSYLLNIGSNPVVYMEWYDRYGNVRKAPVILSNDKIFKNRIIHKNNIISIRSCNYNEHLEKYLLNRFIPWTVYYETT